MRNSRSVMAGADDPLQARSRQSPSRRTDRRSKRSGGTPARGSAAAVSTNSTPPSVVAAASTPRASIAIARSRYSSLAAPSRRPCRVNRRRAGSQRSRPRDELIHGRWRASMRRPAAATAGMPAACPTRSTMRQPFPSRRWRSNPDCRCSQSVSGPSKASAYTRSPRIDATGSKRVAPGRSTATPASPATQGTPSAATTSASISAVPRPPASPAAMSRNTRPVAGSRCCTPPPGADSQRLPSAAIASWSTCPAGAGSTASPARHSSMAPSGVIRSRPLRCPSHSRPAASSSKAIGLVVDRRARLSASSASMRPSACRRSTTPL